MILTVGFDDQEYGTAELIGDDLHVKGDWPDVVRNVLNRWPKLRGAALLRKVDQACNGRFWAALEGDEKPTENRSLDAILNATLNASGGMTHDEAIDEIADAWEALLDDHPDLTERERDDLLDELLDVSVVGNVYCATGKGGGKDPTCKLGQASKAVERAKVGVAKAKAKLTQAQAVLKSARADMAKVKAEIKNRIVRKADPAQVKASKAAGQAIDRLYSAVGSGKHSDKAIDAEIDKHAAVLKKMPLADLRAVAKRVDTVAKSGGKAGLIAAIRSTIKRRGGAKVRVEA